jgi:NAD(P)-dependent dehydrogenase (short-subunit alcohol dehydrogenase family)
MSNTPNTVTYDFSGQTALVTGGGGNLGQAVAHAFYQSGARVVVADRRADLQSLFPSWQGDERVWVAGGVDFLDPEAVQNLVNQTVQRFRSLDILVNTVGGYRAGQPVHETPLETWDFMMDLNLRTTLYAIRAALPSMLAQGAGKIVNTAAASALKGDANSAAYAASKSAVARLTESLSAETRRKGINVNAILPSAIDTPQNRAAMPNADTSLWVTPESIAQVILFLCSPASAPIHGVLLPVFGKR